MTASNSRDKIPDLATLLEILNQLKTDNRLSRAGRPNGLCLARHLPRQVPKNYFGYLISNEMMSA